jgi:flagellar basal-body rod protein FlgB
MLIDGLVNSGSIPVLETSVQFAARRHTLIAHNIANASTPNHQPRDVSVSKFREQLGEAIDERRTRRGGRANMFDLKDSQQVRVTHDRGGQQRLHIDPNTPSGNVLFHDRNDRDLERMMQGLAENAAAFRTSVELLKSRVGLLNSAIALRV